MRLESCRDLKRTLRNRTPELLHGQDDDTWLGLGITRTAPDAYALAVRVPNTAKVADLLSTLAHEAHDEIDVKAVGEIDTLHTSIGTLRGRCRPLIPGCSVRLRSSISGGTVGGFLTVSGYAHILSTNHVLTDGGDCKAGDAVVQPSATAHGQDAERVAALAYASHLHKDEPNRVDAALACVDAGIAVDAWAFPGGALTEVVMGVPEDGRVEKVGQMSGHTQGRVTAFEMDALRINFPGSELVFDDQIEISGDTRTFALGGDSGALVWTSGRAALGMVFAGSRSGGPQGTALTYANRFQLVAEEFEGRLGAPK